MSPQYMERIVIDAGSYSCKAGFSTDKYPRVLIPSAIDSAHLIVSDYQRHYPINRGVVTDWDRMEKLYSNLLNEQLKIANPSEYNGILLSESLFNPDLKRDREKTAEMMFETFGMSSLCMYPASILSLMSRDCSTGIALNIGNETSTIVPLVNLVPIKNAMCQLDYGGSHITTYMDQLLTEQIGYSPGRGSVCIAKEKLAYVAPNLERECKRDPELVDQSFTLPDTGHSFTIGINRFKCTEALFKPSLIGQVDSPGLAEATYQSLMNCTVEQREKVCSFMIMSGGTAALPGLIGRIDSDLNKLLPDDVRVAIPETHNYGTWIGGAKMATASEFAYLFIKRQDYNDRGFSAVHKRCVH